jgi:hypothetical protein
MLGKIYFNKAISHNQMGGKKVLLVPFTMASKGYSFLHESDYNLTLNERNTKNDIADRIITALLKAGIAQDNIGIISFSTMHITIKV